MHTSSQSVCAKLLPQKGTRYCDFSRSANVLRSKSPFGRSLGPTLTASVKLFTGRGNGWKAHLRAAKNIYRQSYDNDLTSFGLAERSRSILCEDRPLLEYEPVIVEEVVAFRFLGGTIIWLDIIFSITAGTAPSLLPYHISVIASNSQTKLENIMGCKNSVMLQIGRIAALYEHKNRDLEQGRFDCTEFEQVASEIGREIHCVLTQGVFEGHHISESDHAPILDTISDPSVLVTHIFAHMASIYVHLVTQGFQELDSLETAISNAMNIVQTRIPRHLLPALVCPLFLIGSVARHGDEQFFRNTFSSPPLLDPLMQHRERILPSLEEIWSRRRTTPDLAWRYCLELTHDILLH